MFAAKNIGLTLSHIDLADLVPPKGLTNTNSRRSRGSSGPKDDARGGEEVVEEEELSFAEDKGGGFH